MTHHNLKITDHWWWELVSGRKTCEARLDDRDYQVGDTIKFFAVDGVTRRGWQTWKVTHVLKNYEGVTPGWVVLSLTDGRLAEALSSVTHQGEVITRRDRSISALRGQITKLRKQLAAAKGGVA
jgi:hypothetical protein